MKDRGHRAAPDTVLWRAGIIDAVVGDEGDRAPAERVRLYGEVAEVALTRIMTAVQGACDDEVRAAARQTLGHIDDALTPLRKIVLF